MNSRVDTVRNLFAAYHAQDRAGVEGAFADGFTFTSPYDDRIDRAEYFRRCWPASKAIGDHELERIVESGDEVIATYLCRMKDGKSFRNTEIMRFEGARIAEITVYFGASYRDGAFVRMETA